MEAVSNFDLFSLILCLEFAGIALRLSHRRRVAFGLAFSCFVLFVFLLSGLAVGAMVVCLRKGVG